ncbi:MAG: hypothetical protein NC115_00565 [Bacteroidales bacterium]|nr:hypothetical protein [Bacteroidales bacterium]
MLSLFYLCVYAQDRPGELAAIMCLMGADSPEDIEQNTLDQIGAFAGHPLRINSASQSRLASSGLFTQYQVVSIIDYRARNGDILSFPELAALDGFNAEVAAALEYFVSLDSNAPAGKSSVYKGDARNSLTLRTYGKYSDYISGKGEGQGFDYVYGFKYRLTLDDRVEFGIAANRPYNAGDAIPGAGTFFLACYGRRNLGKIVVGDYNLRYGQGLAMWSGFNMGGVSYPQSFFRRPSGISPYLSFSGTGGYRGLAADFGIGSFTVSASLGASGLKEIMRGEKDTGISLAPAVNVGWTGRSVQASFTVSGETAAVCGGAAVNRTSEENGEAFAAAAASADFRWCVKGVDIFGEVAMDIIEMSASAVAGTAFKAGEHVEAALSGRYSRNEYGLSSGGKFYAGERVPLAGKTGFGSAQQRHTGTFCADAVYYPYPRYGGQDSDWQVKVLLDYSLRIDSFWSLSARLSERLRSEGEKNRTEIRCDMKWSDGRWMTLLRLNALHCEDIGLLSYLEGGYSGKVFTAYFRAGIFRIDSWKDRIYVYERDAPGNFSIPAYYGRGCSASAVIGIKATRRCRLYMRTSTVQYPWSQPSGKDREGKTEVRLQLVLNL